MSSGTMQSVKSGALFSVNSNKEVVQRSLGATAETDMLTVFKQLTGDNSIWMGFLGTGSTRRFAIITLMGVAGRGVALEFWSNSVDRIVFYRFENGSIVGQNSLSMSAYNP